jgi:hypothetical protein
MKHHFDTRVEWLKYILTTVELNPDIDLGLDQEAVRLAVSLAHDYHLSLIKPFLQVFSSSEMIAVLAGTKDQLEDRRGMVVATFPTSFNDTLYQSISDAEKRAHILVGALVSSGDFQCLIP